MDINLNEEDKQLTVNNSNKYNTVNSITVPIKTEEESIAMDLAKKLDDEKSYKYFLLLVKSNPYHRLEEALKWTLLTDKEGKIRTKKSIYFIAILRRWGLTTNFKKDD